MATKAEVEFWKDQCRKLTAALDRSIKDKDALTARIWDNSEEAKTARAVADGLEWQVEELETENAKLRKLCVQMVKTVECSSSTERCVLFSECEAGEFEPCLYEQELRGLGVEVPDEQHWGSLEEYREG